MLRALRHSLKARLGGITRPIQAGPLEGIRWSVATGSSFISGRYEQAKTDMIVAHTAPGDVVYDVGAHAGYYSMMMARLAGPAGRVFSFEPRPLNFGLLSRHVSVNGFENITLRTEAVSDTTGPLRFNDETGTGTGHLSPEGRLEVQATTLDALLAEGLPPPQLIKIDVEGGELGVLRGGAQLIATHRPKIFLATHGDAIHAECVALLEAAGYRLTTFDQDHGDVESVALYEVPA